MRDFLPYLHLLDEGLSLTSVLPSTTKRLHINQVSFSAQPILDVNLESKLQQIKSRNQITRQLQNLSNTS